MLFLQDESHTCTPVAIPPHLASELSGASGTTQHSGAAVLEGRPWEDAGLYQIRTPFERTW